MSTVKAGRAKMWSDGGPIGNVNASVRLDGGGTDAIITLRAQNVRLMKAEWDVDGNTLYAGSPKELYADSAKETSGKILLDILTDEEFRVETRGRVVFDEFQFRLPTVWPPLELDAKLQLAGCLRQVDWDPLAPGTWLHVDLPAWDQGLAGQPYIFSKSKNWGKC